MSCSNSISGSVRGLRDHFIKSIKGKCLKINFSRLHLPKKNVILEKVHNVYDTEFLKY